MDDIDAMFERLGGTCYEVLGVSMEADRPTIRAAYFESMKRFHPDVFWERDLGLYVPRVEAIFRELTAAFETLCDSRKRGEYDEGLKPPPPPTAVVGVKITGILRRRDVPDASEAPRPVSETPPRPGSGSVIPGVVSGDRTSAVEERVPRDITLQSLQRGRTEHLVKQRRERVTELKELIRQAETRNEAAQVKELLREALSLAPDDPTLRQRLEEAEVATSTMLFERCRNAARVHEKDKRWDAAVDAWIRACNERPGELALLLSMVHASCEGLVDLPRAAEYARRATQLDPRSAEAFALQGRVFFLAGRMASARGAVENALRLDPKHPVALELSRRVKPR